MKLKQKKNLKVLKLRSSKLLLAIIIIAFYLRLQGINSGLPYILNPGEPDNLIKLFGVFKIFKYPALINLLEANPGALLMPLRFVSVLFGVLSIIVLYFIGLRFNPFIALISSGLLSVSMVHVRFSQMFLPFTAVTFFGLLTTYFVIKSYDSEKNIALSIYSALVSFLMHPIGIVNIIPILFFLIQQKSFKKYKSLFFKVFIIGLLLNLNLLLHFPSLFVSFVRNYFFYHSSSYFLYGFKFLIIGIGPVAYFSSILLLKYRNDYDLNLIKTLSSFLVLYIGLLGFLHFTGSEYSVLLIPYLCIFAALFLNSIFERTKTDNKKLIFILLTLFLFWIPLKYTLKYNKLISLSDTRGEATEWVKQNTSENYKIAWDKNSIQLNWHDAYDKRDLQGLVTDSEALTNKQRYPVSYKLLGDKNWFKILKKKVDYIVINSIDQEKILRQPGKKLEKKYYKKILRLKPVIVFNPYLKELDKNTKSLLVEDLYSPLLTLWQRERSGPVIKIYKL